MIDAKTLITKIRILLKDTSKSKYSDFEIMDAISDAMTLLAESSATLQSDRFRKTELINLYTNETDGLCYADIPEDFIEEIKVLFYDSYKANWAEALPVHTTTPNTGEYTLSSNEIVSREKVLKFVYYYIPKVVTSPDDEIDVIKTFMMPIARMAKEVILGNIDTAKRYADFTINADRGARGNDS